MAQCYPRSSREVHFRAVEVKTELCLPAVRLAPVLHAAMMGAGSWPLRLSHPSLHIAVPEQALGKPSAKAGNGRNARNKSIRNIGGSAQTIR